MPSKVVWRSSDGEVELSEEGSLRMRRLRFKAGMVDCVDDYDGDGRLV
jgi:hypothetical protein